MTDDAEAFRLKMKYWRESGHSPFASQPREFFRGQTQREIARDITDAAKRDGREIEYVGRTWV